MNKIMNSVIIEDDPFALIALKDILGNEGITVMCDTSRSLNTIQLIIKLKPGLVIIDAISNDSKEIEVVTKLRRNDYQGIIVIVSGKNNFFHSKCCINSGANAFIGKKEAMENIVAAIQAAKRGYNYFPLITHTPTSVERKIDSLSEQEFKIMLYVLSGAPIRDIAAEMLISPKTVSTYKRRLIFKLNCKTLKDLFILSNN